jgi:hypothetical protein
MDTASPIATLDASTPITTVDPSEPMATLDPGEPQLTAQSMRQQIDDAVRYGLVSPQVLAAFQDLANAQARLEYQRSGLAGLSFETAVADAKEALTGIVADLQGTTRRRSLTDIVTHGDRLRGLGILCLFLALAGLLIDYFMFPPGTAVAATAIAIPYPAASGA